MSDKDDLWRGEREYRVMRFGINEEYMKKKPNEEKKLRNAFIVAAVAVVVVGIVFVATMIIALGQLAKATVDSKADMYDLDCVTQPIEKPLTECKNGR